MVELMVVKRFGEELQVARRKSAVSSRNLRLAIMSAQAKGAIRAMAKGARMLGHV